MRRRKSTLGRLTRRARRAKERRKRETAAERQRRLQNLRQSSYARRQAETAEQRLARLEVQKQRARAFRAAVKSSQMMMIWKKLKEKQLLGGENLKKHHQNTKSKNQQSRDKLQMDSAVSSLKISNCVHVTTEMPVQQDSSLAQISQNITKPATPSQITPSKSKLVKNSNQTTESKPNLSLAQASQNITKPAQVLVTPFQVTPSTSQLLKNPNQTTESKPNSSLAQASQNITKPAQVLVIPYQMIPSKSKLVKNSKQTTESKPNSSLAQASQNITKSSQVLASPFQMTPFKSKLVENPNQTTISETKIRKKDLPKQKFLVTSHQHCVMSNLVSMWRNRKLCDASISNGLSTVMIHKIVLSAASPKLFSIFSTSICSQLYEVKFPEVSTETLMAFVEYIYTGLLDLDLNILQELKVIAKKLDMKDLERMCDAHLLNGTHQQLVSRLSAFDDPRQRPSYVSNTTSKRKKELQIPSFSSSESSKFASAVPTENIKQEISQNELAESKEYTVPIFKQEFEDTSMDTKDSSPPVGSFILPPIKIESVGPDDDKYGQMNKRALISSSVSDGSQTLNTTLNSIAVSNTDFSLPFTTDTTNNNTTANKIHGTSPKLKSDVSEGSLVSDLSSLSYSDEKLCSQSRLIKEEPSEPLNQTITTQSIDNNVTSGSNEGVYPVGLFTAEGDRLPLSTQITSVKNIGLYKIDGFT